MDAVRSITTAAGRYAKAIAALVTPFAIEFVADVVPALAGSDDRGIALVGTALAVWLVPNLPKPKPVENRIPGDVTEV